MQFKKTQNLICCKANKSAYILFTIALICMFFSSNPSWAQTSSISLDLKQATLKQFFQDVEQQSAYRFSYRDNEIDNAADITIDVKNAAIESILSKVLPAKKLQYTVSGNKIVITPTQSNQPQTITQGVVTGTITDKDLGDPVAFATVVVNGTKVMAMADDNGKFSIKAPENAVLQFSFMGYTSLDVPVNGRNVIDVQLAPSTELLEETVIVGFGVQKKAHLTGAVSQIKMGDVAGDRPVINVASALQGSIPGLYITRSSTPGQNSNSINIRGTLSINGSSPLILIDNVPGSLGMLNPDDVESITVLKDAASAAIYGARAAEGVVLISTKRPATGSRFTLNYNNNFGFESSINKPEHASLDEYFRAYLEAGIGGGTYWSNSQDVAKWREYAAQYKANPSSFETIGDAIYIGPDGNPYYLREKDLYGAMFETGFMQNHNLSAAGGTDKVRFRISGGINKDDGPLITSKDKYQRVNASAFVSADVTKWFTQELDIRYARSKKNMPQSQMGGIYSLRLVNYYPTGDLPGSLCKNGEDTPLFVPENQIRLSNADETITSNPRIFVKSILKPLDGLNIIFEYTYDQSVGNYDYYSGKVLYSTIQLAANYAPSSDYYTKQRYSTDYNAINTYANYTKTFGGHTITAMAGFNQESSFYQYVGNTVYDQAIPSLPSFAGATGKTTQSDSYSEYSIRSGFYRVNYDYKGKYLLGTTGRYDGSSKFPKKSRFGFFPSVSAGWSVGKEDFMSFSKGWLSELKLRGSWGQIGNQAINPYQYSPSMGLSNTANVWLQENNYIVTLGLPGLVSQNFTWETVTTINAGIDFGFFNNRLRGSFEWYQRDTKGMLTAGLIQLPAVVGTSAPTQNSASMRTRGWELSLGWRDQIGDFGYFANFNIFDNQSVITKFDNNPKGNIDNYYVGKNLGEIWGYTADDNYYSVDDFENTTSWTLKEGVTSIRGTNVKPGDVKFKNLRDDENSTNRIDDGDHTLDNPGDLSIIGNSKARFHYGLTLGFSYAGFDLTAMLQGVGKRDVAVGGAALFPFAGSGVADGQFQPIYYNQTDYWTAKSYDPTSPDYMVAANPNATLHRIYGQLENSGSNTRTSTKYLQNGAYMRVKNVTLSYRFPAKWTKKIDISQLRLFVNVENLATITSLPKGFDPETLSWTYPFYRTVSFGANITF